MMSVGGNGAYPGVTSYGNYGGGFTSAAPVSYGGGFTTAPVSYGGTIGAYPGVAYSAPQATVLADTNRDGIPDVAYTGADMNRDGIPDSLQGPPQINMAGYGGGVTNAMEQVAPQTAMPRRAADRGEYIQAPAIQAPTVVAPAATPSYVPPVASATNVAAPYQGNYGVATPVAMPPVSASFGQSFPAMYN